MLYEVITIKASASILVVGWSAMKFASGVAATAITIVDRITAPIMTGNRSVMPMAVMTLSYNFV